jgi:hypothetical protein
MVPKRVPHRPLSIGSSHWRADGAAKVSYDTQADAMTAAQWADTDIELTTYRCDFCSGWHLASRSPRSDS